MGWPTLVILGAAAAASLAIASPLVVGALIAAVGLAVLTLARPVIAIGGLLSFLPFNGLATQLLPDGVAVFAVGAAKDYLLLLLLVAAALQARSGVPAAITLPVMALLAVGGLGAFGSESLEQALYGWRNNYFPLLLLLCTPVLVRRDHVLRLTTLIAALAQVVAVIALATWFLGVPWLLTLGILPPVEDFPFQFFTSGSIEPRAFSPYGSPNDLGVATVVMLAVIWCRTDWGRSRVWLSLLPVAALAASQSRSGLLGLVLLAGGLAVRVSYERGGWSRGLGTAVTAAVAAACAGVIALTTGSARFDTSFVGHALSVQEALPKLWQVPLGAGLGQVGPRAVRYTETPILVESYWLLLALEVGVVALVLHLLVLRACARIGWSGDRLAATAPLAIVGSLVNQMVLPTMQEGPVSYLLWIVVGMGVASAGVDAAQKSEFGSWKKASWVPAEGRSTVGPPPRSVTTHPRLSVAPQD